MPLASLTWIRTGAGMLRTLEKTRRLHLEEIKPASEREAHEGSGLVFLRRSQVAPARPPGSGRAWPGLAPGSVSLPLSAGPVVGPRATESRAAARSAANSNKGASMLARNTSLTVGSTLQKINLPPFCRASRCKATKPPHLRLSRETDAAEIDHELRTALLAAMGFISRTQCLYRGRVESPAIPELRDQDPFVLMDLNRGLQHESPIRKRRDRGARVRAGGVHQDASKTLMSDHPNRASCTRTSTVSPPGRSATRITRRAVGLCLRGQRVS